MDVVPKILLLLLFFMLVCLAGLRLYTVINKKIIGSKTLWETAGFTVLLFAALGGLLTGGLYVLIEVYRFLVQNK